MSDKSKSSLPVSVWNRHTEIEPKILIRDIAIKAIEGTNLEWVSEGDSALYEFDESALQEEPTMVAWSLIYHSLISAISRLTSTYIVFSTKLPDKAKLEEISEIFAKKMDAIDVSIDTDFFIRPFGLKLLKEIKTPLSDWLKELGLCGDISSKICDHLPVYFMFALNEKWQAAPEDYVSLEKHFDTWFTKSTEKNRMWRLYNYMLHFQMNDRMLIDPFGVDRVYIPLRAYRSETNNQNDNCYDFSSNIEPIEDDLNKRKIVFDLNTDFITWIKKSNTPPLLRFLSGELCSGKTTFVKRLIVDITNDTNCSALYIPFHCIDASSGFLSSIYEYIENDQYLLNKYIDIENTEEPLLIVLDSLEELHPESTPFHDIANTFIDEILFLSHKWLIKRLMIRIIITGRPNAIQAVSSKIQEPDQIIHMLPYCIKNTDKYKDSENLLNIDQRNEWWRLFGEATNKNFTSLPQDLKTSKLDSLTSQPFHNYLIASSYIRQSKTDTNNFTLNRIYANIIREVYFCQFEKQREHNLNESQFYKAIEEIATTIWHGNGCSASFYKIRKEHKNDISTKMHIDILLTGAKNGKLSSIISCYSQRNFHHIEKYLILEFLNKSIVEYLTARRFLRAIQQIHNQIKRRKIDPDDGLSEREALNQWMNYCSIKAINMDLLFFIRSILAEIDAKKLLEWQKTLNCLLTHTINCGPFLSEAHRNENLNRFLYFARNAEEALLAIHSEVAKFTGNISRLELKNRTAFSEWISRLRGQRQKSEIKLVLNVLDFIDLSGYIFTAKDLISSNLSNTKLEGANFEQANLSGANLSGANLAKANLAGARLENANLQKVNLKKANLEGAILQKADLYKANIENANIIKANFKEANLDNARLSDTKLIDTDFTSAMFSEAYLDQTQIIRSNLEKACFFGASLDYSFIYKSNLNEAKFTYASLESVTIRETTIENVSFENLHLIEAKFDEMSLQKHDFEGAELSYSHMDEANLYMANFERAKMKGAFFRKATIERANFIGAELEEAKFNWGNAKKANFKEANLIRAEFFEADLKGANFKGACLTGADLRYAKLEKAKFRGAELRNVNFKGADIKGANFKGVKLDEVDFEGCINFESAIR